MISSSSISKQSTFVIYFQNGSCSVHRISFPLWDCTICRVPKTFSTGHFLDFWITQRDRPDQQADNHRDGLDFFFISTVIPSTRLYSIIHTQYKALFNYTYPIQRFIQFNYTQYKDLFNCTF